VITSAANPRLKLLRKLRSARRRRKLGLFAVEGEDLVAAGKAAGLEPVDLLVAGEDVEPALLAAVSELAHPPRVVAVFRAADLPRLGPPPRVVAVFRAADLPRLGPSCKLLQGLALWRVSDPGNVGAMLRTADALGPAFVALSAGCADIAGHKALRASAGAVFRVPTCRFEEAPGRRIALVARGGRPLPEVDLDGPVCFVLGAEREGVPPGLLGSCDEAATIPLEPGAESLNVATAAAIALYERRRRLQQR